MRSVSGRNRFLVAGLCALAAVGAPSAEGASIRFCGPVVNPYAGTRYEGVDLRRIRAAGVSCRSARRVARGAHRKALELTPPASGVRRFTWDGWRVTGDLRGSSDRYAATRGDERVRWVFDAVDGQASTLGTRVRPVARDPRCTEFSRGLRPPHARRRLI